MKRVIIIEDETAAAANLESLLRELLPEAQIVAQLESVSESIDFLRSNPSPDIIFMDIHLADGDSFRILRTLEVSAPIIFTTAYDQYALEAFKFSSIDYLLKPISKGDLERALSKLRNLTGNQIQEQSERIKEMVQSHNPNNLAPQQALLVHHKDKIIPLSNSDIAYIYTRDERVSVCDNSGAIYSLNRPLETLQAQLPESQFFRANRQYIISRHSIKDISVWFGSRLTIALSLPTPERIVIPKAKVPEFKRWLTTV